MKNIRRHIEHHLLTALLVLASSSCTVKEMRGGCPCWVDLDFEQYFSRRDCGDIRARLCEVRIYDADGNIALKRLMDCDTMSLHYEETLGRGTYDCTALFFEDYEAYTHGEAVLSTRLDARADSLYGSHVALDASGEKATAAFDARKQFANVNVRFVNCPDSVWVDLQGLSTSVSSATLMAEKGSDNIRVMITAQGGGETDFKIMRQWSDSLTMVVTSAFSGSVLARVDIKHLLADINYNFRAESLKDIYIVIDFRRGLGTIVVEDWDNEYVFAII